MEAAAARSGGGTVRVRELADSFSRIGTDHRYLFVVRRSLAPLVKEGMPAARILSPPSHFDRPPARLIWEHALLPRAAHSWAPDIVFSPFNVLPIRWPSPRPRLALIVSNLAPYSDEVKRMYRGPERFRLEILRRLTDRSIAHADRVFLLSHHAIELIGSTLLDGKAEIIPMAPPTFADLPDSNVGAGSYFLIVSDLLRYKGIELAIEAMGSLGEGQRPSLLICGNPLDSAYVARLRRQVRRLGLGHHVRFLGSLGHSEVIHLLRSSIACIVPSRFENKSRVPVEAMALGVPIIASDIPTFRDSCGGAALYFDLAQPVVGLAGHLRRIVDSEPIRLKLKEAGRARAKSTRATEATELVLRSLRDLAEEST